MKRERTSTESHQTGTQEPCTGQCGRCQACKDEFFFDWVISQVEDENDGPGCVQ